MRLPTGNLAYSAHQHQAAAEGLGGPTAILHQLESDIEAARFDKGSSKIELPVKLRVHDSVFVPLAKWAMLVAGNYCCVQEDAMRPIPCGDHRKSGLAVPYCLQPPSGHRFEAGERVHP